MPQSPAQHPYEYIVTPAGSLTTPPGSPKILIHNRGGKCVGIYCDQPAKILQVETQANAQRITDPRTLAFVSAICPQTSVKAVGGYGTSIDHMLTMALDDPSMDDDLRAALAAHEIVFEEEWADVE